MEPLNEILRSLLPAGGLAAITAFVVTCVVAILRLIPQIGKITIDGQEVLRENLLRRVEYLEAENTALHGRLSDMQSALARAQTEHIEDRRQCDQEIRELRKLVDGMQRSIGQNSQSAAMLMGDPAAVAVTRAARRKRGDEPS